MQYQKQFQYHHLLSTFIGINFNKNRLLKRYQYEFQYYHLLSTILVSISTIQIFFTITITISILPNVFNNINSYFNISESCFQYQYRERYYKIITTILISNSVLPWLSFNNETCYNNSSVVVRYEQMIQ